MSEPQDLPSPLRALFVRALPYLLIAIVLFAVRGFYVRKLGIYWDDWRIFTRGVEGGPVAILKYLCAERLFMGVPHALLYAVFGVRPMAWHFANIGLEFGCAVLLFQSLKRVLREESALPLLVTLLYLAYPMSLIRTHLINVYINTALFCSLLSLLLTVLALEGVRYWRVCLVGAVLLIPCSLLMYEFGFGFELARLTILARFLCTREPTPIVRLKAVVRGYAPYLLGLATFAVGRFVVQPRLAREFAGGLRESMKWHSFIVPSPSKMLDSLVYLLQSSWWNAPQQVFSHPVFPERDTIRMWAWGGVVFFAIFLYGYARAAREETALHPKRRLTLLGFSFFLSCVLIAPIWIAKAQLLHLGSVHSRHGYFASIGASLFIVTALQMATECFSGERARRIALHSIAGIFIAIGAAYNQLHTRFSVQDWRETRAFWQQATILMPSLEKGSLVVVEGWKRSYRAFGSIRNRDIYEPAQLFYGLKYGEVYGSPTFRLGKSFSDWLEESSERIRQPKLPIGPDMGVVNLSQMVSLRVDHGVINVLRPLRYYKIGNITQSQKYETTQPIVDSLPSEETMRLRRIFLGRPVESWQTLYAQACYKMARGDWDGIYAIALRASDKRLKPMAADQALVFWEAALRNGDTKLAGKIVRPFRSMTADDLRLFRFALDRSFSARTVSRGDTITLKQSLGKVMLKQELGTVEPSPPL